MTKGAPPWPWPPTSPTGASSRKPQPRITATLGPVDVLVNNAGISSKADALDVTPQDWGRVLAVNLDGVWNCCQIFGAGMVARGSGSIINIGSMSGFIVNRPQNQPAYNARRRRCTT